MVSGLRPLATDVTTYWLSMHVPYVCRHSGACCTSGWPIPVERDRIAPLRVLRPDGQWLVRAPDAPSEIGGILASDRDGRCVFYGQAAGQRSSGNCEIHRQIGHAALPSACQHFPRECLIDRRGVFVTLSHYCPTAASLLFRDTEPVRIVEGPQAIPSGQPEGLDAHDVLPPLLRPGLLMDHTAHGLWEAHIVRVLTTSDCAPEAALNALDADARSLSGWRWPDGALADAVLRLRSLIEPTAMLAPEWPREQEDFATALGSLTTGTWAEYPESAELIWPRRVATGWHEQRHVIKRWLAAHAFAAWMTYQGNGVLAQIARLHVALAVLRAESVRGCVVQNRDLDAQLLTHAIRQTDLLIVHLIDRAHLAARLSWATRQTLLRRGRGRWSRTRVAP